jgi:hypothetical protein
MDYKLVPNFNSDGSFSGIETHVHPDHSEPFNLDVFDIFCDIFDYVRTETTETLDGQQILVVTTKKVI